MYWDIEMINHLAVARAVEELQEAMLIAHSLSNPVAYGDDLQPHELEARWIYHHIHDAFKYLSELYDPADSEWHRATRQAQLEFARWKNEMGRPDY